MTERYLKNITKQIRKKIIDMAYKGNGAHISSCLSITDLLVVLYWDILKINPKKPKELSRDRFILSKGHAASALYAVLAQKGFFQHRYLETYGSNNTFLGVHPEYDTLPGIEFSTGSLGHGLSVGAGMALAAKLNKLECRTFVLISDGECNEGSVWEGVLFSAHMKLDNLIIIIDYNKLQAFGRTKDIMNLEPFAAKWRAFGWATIELDGHNLKQLQKVFHSIPLVKNKPTAFIAHTIAGKGVSFLEDKLEWHYLNLKKEQYKMALEEIKKQ